MRHRPSSGAAFAICGYIHGVDSSEPCLRFADGSCPKLVSRLPGRRLELGDITSLDLGQSFDLITAPWRVLQNLYRTKESMVFSERFTVISTLQATVF